MGTCFPVLMHELSKCVIRFLIDKAIPNHLPEHELFYILQKGDKFHHEWWHYYLGPTLWQAILKTADTDSQNLPKILSAMSLMEYEELSDFCINITFFEHTGIKTMTELKRNLNIK